MRWLQTWSLLVSCITSFLFTICVWGDCSHEVCWYHALFHFFSPFVCEVIADMKSVCLYHALLSLQFLSPVCVWGDCCYHDVCWYQYRAYFATTHQQFCVLFQSYMSPVDLIHSVHCIIVWRQWFGFKHEAAHTDTANINCVQSWVHFNRIQLRFSLCIQHTSNRMILYMKTMNSNILWMFACLTGFSASWNWLNQVDHSLFSRYWWFEVLDCFSLPY